MTIKSPQHLNVLWHSTKMKGRYDLLLRKHHTRMTYTELATKTGVTPAYIDNVITGKMSISEGFALALEHAFGVPKSFWINLQANYDAEKTGCNRV